MKPRRQILKSALLGVLVLLLLNFPFLGIPNHVALFFSIPTLYVHVFGVWLLFIVLLFLLMERPFFKGKNDE